MGIGREEFGESTPRFLLTVMRIKSGGSSAPAAKPADHRPQSKAEARSLLRDFVEAIKTRTPTKKGTNY